MSRSKKSTQRAVRTRAARRNFRNRYGTRSYEIVRRWFGGEDTSTIASNVQTTVRTVAATVANINRVSGFSDAAVACNF